MVNENENPRLPLGLAQGIIEFMLREAVETGRLEIGDRPITEIMSDFDTIIGEFISEYDEDSAILRSSIDHRGILLRQAREATAGRHHGLAITLYAIWLEHFVNGMITRAFERMDYEEEVCAPLIRELRLPTKATALWRISNLPAIDPDDLKIMNRVIELRNSFVHYKWHSYDDSVLEQQQEELQRVTEQAEQLVLNLLGIESTAFWNGRDGELLSYLQEDMNRKWEGSKSDT
jgi:hypothetical protein